MRISVIAVLTAAACAGEPPTEKDRKETEATPEIYTTAQPECVSGDDIQSEIDAGAEWIQICAGTTQ